MKKTRVIVKSIHSDPELQSQYLKELDETIASIFSIFGGNNLLKSSGDVYIKPNAIDAKPFAYTRPEIVESVINYFKSVGANRIYLMENSTQSNYTRIVFDAIGYTKICRRTKAIPIYLDEKKTTTLEFQPSKNEESNQSSTSEKPSHERYDRNTFDIPKVIVDKLIQQKDENLYINLPKLKMHSMGVVTLGIKISGVYQLILQENLIIIFIFILNLLMY